MKNKNTEELTGELYSDCFEKLNSISDYVYYQGEMLAKNVGLSKELVKDKICLDGGCGHAALTYQMLKLGAKKAYGFDLKPTPRKDFFSKFENVRFVSGSLLDIPFEDNTFDLVVSTGVVHHTINPEKAFSELARVLKPEGTLILGMYGKYGLFPWSLQILRTFTVKIHLIPKKLVEKIINLIGLDPMIRYQVLDYAFVPRLNRYSTKEIKDWYKKYQLTDTKRIYNLSTNEAAYYRSKKTVYTYNPKRLWNRILFGYGFIVMHGRKLK